MSAHILGFSFAESISKTTEMLRKSYDPYSLGSVGYLPTSNHLPIGQDPVQSKDAFDRTLLLEQLADARERVDDVQKLKDGQSTHVQTLRQHGHDTESAEAVLAQLEQSQTKFSVERDELEALVAKLA
jgi:hypothetical protein